MGGEDIEGAEEVEEWSASEGDNRIMLLNDECKLESQRGGFVLSGGPEGRMFACLSSDAGGEVVEGFADYAVMGVVKMGHAWWADQNFFGFWSRGSWCWGFGGFVERDSLFCWRGGRGCGSL